MVQPNILYDNFKKRILFKIQILFHGNSPSFHPINKVLKLTKDHGDRKISRIPPPPNTLVRLTIAIPHILGRKGQLLATDSIQEISLQKHPKETPPR